MPISVIGSGRWGTCIAWYQAAHLKQDVLLMDQPGSKNYIQLRDTRKNDYLSLPDNIQMTDSLEAVLCHSDRIIISVGAQVFRTLCKQINAFDVNGKTFILCMKGIEKGTGARLSVIMKEEIKQNIKIAIWVGPGHPQEFVRGVPSCMVIDSDDVALKTQLTQEFSTDLIRFYVGNDLIGTELGAALKNVIGIAAGILDGLNFFGLKGALMTRGCREVGRFIASQGGHAESAYGLAHLGDYEATLFSPHSHNRMFGEGFAKGQAFDKLAEGVDTLRAVLDAKKETPVDMPICDALAASLFDGQPISDMLKNLFGRRIKPEFE